MTNREARSKGLIWSRRKGVNNPLELNDRPATDDVTEVEKTKNLKRKIHDLKEHSNKKSKPDINETNEVHSRAGDDDDLSISSSESDLDLSPQ